MKLSQALRAFAGMMVLLMVALSYFVSEWWLLLGVFIGLNLLQSAFTNNCPAIWALKKLGFKGGA